MSCEHLGFAYADHMLPDLPYVHFGIHTCFGVHLHQKSPLDVLVEISAFSTSSISKKIIIPLESVNASSFYYLLAEPQHSGTTNTAKSKYQVALSLVQDSNFP